VVPLRRLNNSQNKSRLLRVKLQVVLWLGTTLLVVNKKQNNMSRVIKVTQLLDKRWKQTKNRYINLNKPLPPHLVKKVKNLLCASKSL